MNERKNMALLEQGDVVEELIRPMLEQNMSVLLC